MSEASCPPYKTKRRTAVAKGSIVLVYSDFDDQTKIRKIALSVKPTVPKKIITTKIPLPSHLKTYHKLYQSWSSISVSTSKDRSSFIPQDRFHTCAAVAVAANCLYRIPQNVLTLQTHEFCPDSSSVHLSKHVACHSRSDLLKQSKIIRLGFNICVRSFLWLTKCLV